MHGGSLATGKLLLRQRGCSGSAVAAARLYGGGPASPRQPACGTTYAINSPVARHTPSCLYQLGVRFILLAAQLATALFLRYDSNLTKK